jgi:hypothetical protein
MTHVRLELGVRRRYSKNHLGHRDETKPSGLVNKKNARPILLWISAKVTKLQKFVKWRISSAAFQKSRKRRVMLRSAVRPQN